MSEEEPAGSESKKRWAASATPVFLEHAGLFVPGRELQIETICDLIPDAPAGALVVELCCGEGLLAHALLLRHPNCRILALDGSPGMLARASERLAEFGSRVELREFDLVDTGWRRFAQPLHAVVSSLTIHHLDREQKQGLFRDVAAALAPGGAFIIADLVQPRGRLGVKVAARQWDDAVRERSLRERGDLSGLVKFRELNWNDFSSSEPSPIDKPSSLLDQLLWLEAAGLAEVDVYWMKAGHAIFGGRRP
jgi:tRNA (cmo5U34)-methyltransferase